MSVFSRASKNPSSAAGPQNSPQSQPGAKSGPSEQEIRALAYQKFLARGGKGGDAAGDWFNAERELRAKYQGR